MSIFPFGKMAKPIIYVKIHKRQTDRQTNSWTPYTGVCVFFLQVKFATFLLASLAGGLKQNINRSCFGNNKVLHVKPLVSLFVRSMPTN